MDVEINTENKTNEIRMNIKVEAIFEKEITHSGTGGHIIIPNKYVGKMAIIMIKNE